LTVTVLQNPVRVLGYRAISTDRGQVFAASLFAVRYAHETPSVRTVNL